jgi:hypothetical protein
MATKRPVVVLQVTERQRVLDGKPRWVHVIPSVDDAAVAEFSATATKTPVEGLHAAPYQDALVGKVRWVHVMPSVDEAAIVL